MAGLPSSPAASPTLLQVFIFKNGEFVGSELFVERRVVVGRDPDVADLVLDSDSVSRRHAQIEHDCKTISLLDAGSSNGIYVNRQRVEAATVSRRDDVVVGEYSLKLKLVRQSGGAETGSRGSTLAEATMMESLETVQSGVQPGPTGDALDSVTGASRRGQAASPSTAAIEPGGTSRFQRSGESLRRLRRRAASPGLASRAEPQRWTVTEASTAPRSSDDAAGLAGFDMRQQKGAGDGPEPGRARGVAPARSAHAQPGSGRRRDPREALGVAGRGYEYDEDDDEDDDDATFVPAFSLAQRLKREAPRLYSGGPAADCCVEVLHLRGDSVVDATLVWPGEAFWVGPEVGFARRYLSPDIPKRHRMLRHKRSGDCVLSLPPKAVGTIARSDRPVSLSRGPDGPSSNETLRPGDLVDLDCGSDSYHMRYVTPPQPLRDPRPILKRLTFDPRLARALWGSLGGHLVLVALVSLLAVSEDTLAMSSAKDEFAEVPLDVEMALEEPEPEPEPPAPEPEPEPPAPEPEPAAPPRPRKRKKPRMMSRSEESRAKQPKAGGLSPGKPGVLGLLSKRGSSAAPGPAAAVAAVSNLSAANVPGGQKGFRVSGLIRKLPTSSLQVGGGGGGPITRGGAALLRGGAGGAGRLAGGKGQGVRGLVSKEPRAMRSTGQGTLSREAIQLVINQNIGQIQRCYERELVKNAGISGKVQVEWTISQTGAVSRTRQTYSDLSSVNVVNCILGRIKTWQFPRPKGGSVVVNYPFVFKSIGF